MLNPVRQLLCWIGADPIATGTVVGMRHYVAIAAEESWLLSVRGLDRFGELVTEEIFVEPLTWSNTKIGDIYRR
jgi:hypothetical protein